MCRKIVVTSGKGGVGKTTVTTKLGINLSKMGRKVVLIDGDVGLNNLDVVMGVENKVVYDMCDVLSGKCRIKQALIPDLYEKSLFVLPSAHAYESDDISPQGFRALVDALSEDFDYIIIDCPAGIEGGFHRAVSSATEALVVTTPHISSVRDADKVLSLLSTYNMIDIGLVVNRLRGDLVISGEMMSEGDISRLLRCKPMGVIPEDDLLLQSQADRTGRNSGCSAIAFNLLADNIENGNKRIYDCTARFRGFFSKIKLMMRNKV